MKYYCIGIKGSGMSTLAQMLYDMGNEVSGYDDAKDYKFTQKGLEERGIKIFYDGNHKIDKDTVVTASRAFSDEHPEIKRIKELGLTFKPYNEVVGEITKEFNTISVSGTHGKTTTTSLLKHLFTNTTCCNYFIGDGTGHIDMKNKLLVIESDEFNRHFLAYYPTTAIITCIELEHTEINEVIFYGEDESNDYIIKNIKLETSGSSFDLYKKDEFIDNFTVPLYGHHMVMNTVGAIICALDEGVSKEKIKELLPSFKNADRRFAETIIGNTIIVDDYAHHPTEIKVTLEAIRQKYPDRKLTVVFRPNTYSRTSHFKNEFAEALSIADKVYLTPIKCDRENPNDYPKIKSEDIIELIPGSELIDDNTVNKVVKDKDGVVAFMGCATVSHLIENFTKALENIE